MPACSITSSNACWLFFSDSNEARHLSDIIHAADKLQRRGVATRDIFTFTDHPLAANHLHPFHLENIYPVAAFSAFSSTLNGYEAAVAIITGHGHPQGIGTPGAIVSPFALSAAIRAIPKIKVGLLVLCQCFAGIFNYIDARTAPPLVIMGATNLNLSLSTPLTLAAPIQDRTGAAGLQSWVANIFMARFFEWLETPMDIDGDGALTLMDAYKAAATRSNQDLVQIKSGLFVAVEQASAHLKQLRASVEGHEVIPPTTKLSLDAAEQNLQRLLETLHLHQEPWVLNADQGRDVRFW